ncbi:ero1-like protein [Uloborus diversus]|uniref:ero1-like protein n=1 Tax=Uloborus diversus TaxID=327109 RepID=UPI00240A9440|nr:ero1-like protein [Uloborus diversus]
MFTLLSIQKVQGLPLLYAFSVLFQSLAYCSFEPESSGGCFCKLEGRIDDCSCNIDTVDHFNNIRLYPILKSLLVSDFFRYIKVNLNRACPFWPDDGRCAMRDCSVQMCSEEQIPPGLKGHEQFLAEAKKLSRPENANTCDENFDGLGAVNETISDENYEGFERWQRHDDAIDTFCEMDDETSAEVQYVDLLLNPERYTGYKGSSAHRIWNSIYRENCFKFGEGYGPYTTSKNLNAMCLEKRAFYRAISGLHSSISIHLCAQYYTKAKDCFGKGAWGPNVQEFHRRFAPELTNGEGPHWLKNLYFVYLLELRAIAKAAPYFENELFYTGNDEADREVRQAIKKLVEVAKSFPDHFNENVMFSGNDKETRKLKEEFRLHFLNISRIMDCVGCDKCRLWGKIQVQGLGTAFKILFSKDLSTNYVNRKQFRLSRSEIVSLFNAFGRLSNSIHQLEIFRTLLNHTHDEL